VHSHDSQKKKELLILFWHKEKTCASTHTLQSKVAHKTITQINATVHVNATLSTLFVPSIHRHFDIVVTVTNHLYRHSHGYLYITIYEFIAIDSVLPRSSYGHDAIRAPSPSPKQPRKVRLTTGARRKETCTQPHARTPVAVRTYDSGTRVFSLQCPNGALLHSKVGTRAEPAAAFDDDGPIHRSAF
jgi:hypothetical protein